MPSPVTVPALQQMKRDGRKIVGVVAWDYQMAQIVDRAGVDIVSVGDTVGINLWGQPNPLEVTLDEMLVVCKAVRRGVKRALVSVDFPFGPLQQGSQAALAAAIRLVKEAGADMVKLDGAADFPDAVRAIARAGIPVFAQFGITPQTALQYGIDYNTLLKTGDRLPPEMTARMVDDAKRLEKKILGGGMTLEDFADQLRQVRKMGPIGQLLIRLAFAAGASAVVATDILPHRVQAARAAGAAAELVDGGAERERLLAALGGRPVDAAIEIAGVDDAIATAAILVRPGGTVVVAGIPSGNESVVPASVLRRKGVDLRFSRRMNRVHREAIALVAGGRVRPGEVVTAQVGFAAVDDAFRTAARREGGKVVVLPGA